MGKCLARICGVPFRKIVEREYCGVTTVEVLSCGHKRTVGREYSMYSSRRRCYTCTNNGHITYSHRTLMKNKRCECAGCIHAREILKKVASTNPRRRIAGKGGAN
jgi:hypothetical protein